MFVDGLFFPSCCLLILELVRIDRSFNCVDRISF